MKCFNYDRTPLELTAMRLFFFGIAAINVFQKLKKMVVNVVIVVFCGLTYCFSMGYFLFINCCTALYLLQKKKNYNRVQQSTTIEFQFNKLKYRCLQQIQQKQRALMFPIRKTALMQVATILTNPNTFAR